MSLFRCPCFRRARLSTMAEPQLLVSLLVPRQLVVEEPAVILAITFDQLIECVPHSGLGPREGLEVGPALDPAGRAIVDARIVLEITFELDPTSHQEGDAVMSAGKNQGDGPRLQPGPAVTA